MDEYNPLFLYNKNMLREDKHIFPPQNECIVLSKKEYKKDTIRHFTTNYRPDKLKEMCG